VLLVELDGVQEGVDADLEVVRQIALDGGARNVKIARDETERLRLWQGRKKAFGAMGRLSPHLVVQDAVIPRSRLAEILGRIEAIRLKYGVIVCNVFHAGDGNLHPNIPYNADDPEESERVHLAMREIMASCISVGGSITGEHGVGSDKRDYMPLIFDAPTLDTMCAVRRVFDPEPAPTRSRSSRCTPAASGGREA
jgi:FAD/FMN-containing dehydrogenases